jgi:hypothetical protein
MAKKNIEARPVSDLDSIIDAEFDTLTDLSKKDTRVNLWYSWGIYALNYISSKNMYNGVPAGRISSLKGLSGCLSPDTLIPINRGERSSVRWYRIEDLYKKIKGIRVDNPHIWKEDIETNTFSLFTETNTSSLWLEEKIGYAPIAEVIDSGEKETFTLTTDSGRSIRCTAEHPFKVPTVFINGRGIPEKDYFVSLKDLKIGDNIYCLDTKRNRFRFSGGRKKQRREISGVEFHPYAWRKTTGKYNYKRIHFSRLVVEAYENKLPVSEFINIIKYDQARASRLKYFPMDLVVHHINEDPTDDRIENLQVLSKIEHDVFHTVKKQKSYLDYQIETVVSIERYGIEHTYDISMKGENKNFVANGFIVHNTGKSLLLASLSKDPKIDKIIAIGSEGGGLSAELFEFAGVPLNKIRISQYATFASYKVSKKTGKIEEITDAEFPIKTDTDDYHYVEGATRFIKRFINAIEFKGIKANIVIMLDSLANVKSVRELGGTSDMGARAKDINNFFGIFDNAFERTNIAFVFTNKLYTRMGDKYDPWQEAGGEGAIYNPSLSLWLSDSAMANSRDKNDKEVIEEKDRRKTALGSSLKLIKAKVDKSRFGTELRNIDFLIDMSSGPVRLSGLFQLCEDFGVLVKSGNSYTLPDVIEGSFYKNDFISIVAKDEENIIAKLQKKFEEAEKIIKSAKQMFQASDLDDIPEETDLNAIKRQMEVDLEP